MNGDTADTDDLSPERLAARWVARLTWARKRLPGPPPPGLRVTLWEDWIVRDPERAWPLMVEMVRQARGDADLLERVWSRLGMLLSRHGNEFLPRVRELVESDDVLRRIAPAEALDLAFYAPRPVDEDALVRDYFAVLEHGERSREVESLVRHEPVAALPLVLQIIERGPREGPGSRGTGRPLFDLLQLNGEAVIGLVEAAAEASVPVRRCLWRAVLWQRHPADEHAIAPHLMDRVERAAAGTTDYNSGAPEGDVRPLPDEGDERIVASWLIYERSFWAWEHADEVLRRDPQAAWPLMVRLIREAPDERLEYLAAGELENLVCLHGPALIDRIEAQAAADARFRWALGCIWLSRGALPADVEARVVAASGGEILLLDVDDNEGIEPADQEGRQSIDG